MFNTQRKVRLYLGGFIIALGGLIWSLDDSSTVGEGPWYRNWWFFIPGFLVVAAGAIYIVLMAYAPSATERSLWTVLFGKRPHQK